MVTAGDLGEGVTQHRLEHVERVGHAAARAGRLATKVRPATPTRPRDSMAVGTPLATPAARIASATPGTSRSSSGSVCSGVASVGVRPVPPGRQHEIRLAREDVTQGQPELVAVGHDDRVRPPRSPSARSRSTMTGPDRSA